jgi:hypothetical protein
MDQYGGQVGAAASPASAGHRRTQTRPDEVLEMHAADQPPPQAPLHTHPVRLDSASDGVNPLWMLVAGLALAVITAFFVLVRA